MKKRLKLLTILLTISLIIFSFGCKKNPDENITIPPPIIVINDFTVVVYSLDFAPINGIEIYDDKNNILCKTDKNGKASFKSSEINPYEIVELDQNKFSFFYSGKKVVIKDDRFKNICFVTYPNGKNAEFKFFLDDVNSDNELIEENFITMHGKVSEHFEFRPLEGMEFRINGNLVGSANIQGNFMLETMFFGQTLKFVYEKEIVSMKYGFEDLPNKDFIILEKGVYPIGGNGFRFILSEK